ncbi:unnamed protein product [Symbiodinium sp. CCMP2592]|nr:unnamed protein product [Symbiodinium sp. CCMP2592]
MRYSVLAHILTSLNASLPLDVANFFHFVEFFSGCGILTAAVEAAGLRVRSYDVLSSKSMDLNSAFGWTLALNMVRHVVATGLIWFGIPCSTWIFMSRGSCRRTWFVPQGMGSARCRNGNRLCRRMCYLLRYAVAKKLYFVIENPTSTLLWQYGPLRKLLRKIGVMKVSLHLGSYGAFSPKAVTLVGNWPCLRELPLIFTKARRTNLRRVRSFLNIKTTTRWKDKQGKQRCAGGKDLKTTQNYPAGFGIKVG